MKSMPLYLKKSFTLIELIMTIVVLGLIAIPLSISLTAQVEGLVKSGQYTQALNLARYEMERVNNLPFASVITTRFSRYQGYPYDVVDTVRYVQGGSASAEALKQIAISVSNAGTSQVLTSLTTYIAKNVKYGL